MRILQLRKKLEKELTLYDQIVEKEREKEEIESRRFHKIEGNFVPRNYISFDFDFDSKSFLPGKKHILNKKKERDNKLISDLIIHYKKKLSELKEVQQKQEKSTDNKSSEYSSNTSETSESDDSSYQSQEGSKKEEENINNEIENK